MDLLTGLLDADLSATAFAVLVAAAFATSILSAIIGMAGGITLLAVMLLFYEPLIVIPLHGVVQLVSNSSRAIIQRRHLRWGIIARYGILILPMGFVGLAIAREIPPDWARGLIGSFVLLATWTPQFLMLGSHPEEADPNRRFLLLGGAVGILNVTVGATGPIIAPFFLNLGLDRFQLIGTKAACQVLGHLAKLVIFGVTGFVFSDYLALLGALSLAVVAGTWVGSRLLHRVNEIWFIRLYKTVLTVIAVHLALEGIFS